MFITKYLTFTFALLSYDEDSSITVSHYTITKSHEYVDFQKHRFSLVVGGKEQRNDVFEKICNNCVRRSFAIPSCSIQTKSTEETKQTLFQIIIQRKKLPLFDENKGNLMLEIRVSMFAFAFARSFV